MPFKIIRNDITKVKADAIVNTVNPYGFIGRGVETAIYHAAGSEELLEERRKLGILHPGDVGITPAFNLDAKYIIHVSGPVWKDGRSNELAILRQCYDKALYMAVENNCKSYNNSIVSVCYIHKDLCSFSGLCILIRNIFYIYIMSDINKMPLYGFNY